MSRTPTLAEALRGILDARVADLRVSIPARVESYDATKQRIDAQPLIRHVYEDEDGARHVEDLPVVTDVPVCFPGSGPYSITWTLAKGDTVLLVFADASLDRWLVRGGAVDPGDTRTHAPSDAIAIPGLRDFAHALEGDRVHGSAMVISAPEIRAGGSQALAFNADLEALRSALSGLTTGPTSPVGTAASGVGAFSGTSVLKGG